MLVAPRSLALSRAADMVRDRDRTGKARARGWFAPALALLAVACAPASPVTAVRNNAPPSLASTPVFDAILVEVAAPDQVLALSHYSRDRGSSSIPARYRRRALPSPAGRRKK